MKKLTIGILYGGKSTEHEVSLRSAHNVLEAINREKFTPVLIKIEKSGLWEPSEAATALLDCLTQGHKSKALPDVIFPVLHGTNGEDGTVQGLLELLDIPYVGAGVLGSAVGMDKDVMKRLLKEAGLPIPKFEILHAHQPVPSFEAISKALGMPFFVKPANAGSSVGVSKIYSENEFHAAVKDAFTYDHKLMLEEAITGAEIECSILGNSSPKASLPGKVIPQAEFYSYDAKYIDENGAIFEIPTPLPDTTIKEIQALATQAFTTICCSGMARVDMFLTPTGNLLINEINTIPGFTSISMYPKLWEASGLSYTNLITELIDLAIERHSAKLKLATSFIA